MYYIDLHVSFVGHVDVSRISYMVFFVKKESMMELCLRCRPRLVI
jgi:hypothetical protein